jgi:hypothetical protein
VYKTLRTFRPILLRTELHVHTDHRNLPFKQLNSHHVLYWRLRIEEFTSTFHCTPRLIRYRAAPISLVEATRSEDNDNNESGRFPLVEATRSEVCDTNDDSHTQPTDFPCEATRSERMQPRRAVTTESARVPHNGLQCDAT